MRRVPESTWVAASQSLSWPDDAVGHEVRCLESALENVIHRDWLLTSRSELEVANRHMENLTNTLGRGGPVSDQNARVIISSLLPTVLATCRPLLNSERIVESSIFDAARKAEKLAREAAEGVESAVETVTHEAFKHQAERISAHVREASESAKAAREAAEQAGVASNARYFQTQARAHQVASRWWLAVTLLGAAATLSVLGWMLLALKDDSADLSLAGAGLRVALVSFCAYLVAWCGRSFRAEKHNQITNQRRQIALNTLDALTGAAGDDDRMKASVIGQVTAAIFGATSSGYGPSDEPTAGPMSTLVEKVFLSKR
ncbi:MAG: hypothetical protein VYE22_10040 [Myxococcota bacterium]|nr:hypothetical protein [Myxococcota bacterium]